MTPLLHCDDAGRVGTLDGGSFPAGHSLDVLLRVFVGVTPANWDADRGCAPLAGAIDHGIIDYVGTPSATNGLAAAEASADLLRHLEGLKLPSHAMVRNVVDETNEGETIVWVRYHGAPA